MALKPHTGHPCALCPSLHWWPLQLRSCLERMAASGAICSMGLMSSLYHLSARPAALCRFLTYRMTGHWFVFFTIQAPIVALESSIKRVFKHRGHELPWWLSIPLTLGLMLILADWFFFPPCFITGLDEKVTSSMRNNIQGLLQVLHLGGERQVQLQA